MSAHTKGPWSFNEAETGYYAFGHDWLIVRSNAYKGDSRWMALATIDSTQSCHMTVDEQKANARLIAASPELLFALSQIVSELPAKRDWLNPDIERIARAAIAKATGEESA